MMDRYADLGRGVRQELDVLVSDSGLCTAVEAKLFGRRDPQPRRLLRWFAYASVGLVAATALLLWAWPQGALTFTVAGDGSGAVGTMIAAPREPKLLAFSEGTTVLVAPAGKARILRMQPQGADVALEGGTLQAHVKHKASTRWVFHAGPYEVLVTGTKFDLTWEANTQRLMLAMHEGRVLVQGGAMQTPREVRAGERFVIGDAPAILPPAIDVPAERPIARVSHPFLHPPAPISHAVARPRSHQLARAPLLEQEKRNPAAVLFGRADAARLSGDEPQAVRLFQDVAQRYPSHRLAGLASFAAGRLLLLRLGDARAALSELERARRLGLGAPLNEDCHARIVEALSALQRQTACKDEQSRYLAAFPRGPHADLVKKACR